MPGDRGFDPLRFTDSDWNMAEVIIPKERWMGEYGTVPMVYWMREAELKHGRICMLATVGYLTVVELCSMVSVVQAAKGSGRAAGDFSLDPLEFCENPETKSFMLEAEITHARLAMLGFSGLVTQSALLEKGF